MVVDPVDDAPERLDERQLLDDALVDARLVHPRQAHPLGQLAQDLDPLDRVDAQLGLEVEIRVQHLHRVTRPLAHDRHDRLEQRLGAEHRRRRGGDGGPGRERLVVAVVVDPVDDAPERLDERQLLDDALVDARLVHPRQAHPLGQLAQDLDPLDRVDAQLGLEVEIRVQHLHRVTRPLAHDRHDGVEQRLGAEQRRSRGGGGDRSRVPLTGAPLPLPVAADPDRRPRRRRSVDDRRLHDEGRRRRRRPERGQDDVALGRHDLLHAPQVLGHEHLRVAAGRGGRRLGGERDGRELVGGRQRARHPLAVGRADPAAVEQVRRPGGHGRGVDRLGVAAVEQHPGVDRHPGRGQLGQRQQESADPVVAGGIAGHRGVRAVAEDLADELGQHPSRPGLDEHPSAGRVHRLDLLAERHRRRHLAGEALAHGGGIAVVGRGRGVRPHGEAGHRHLDVAQVGGEGVGGRPQPRRVEGAGDGQPAGAIPALGQPRHGLGHLVGRPRDHALVGRVVVGHDHVGPGGERAPDLVDRASHRGHGPGVVVGRGVEDGLAPGPAERDEVAGVEGARGHQRRQLAVAVPAGGGGHAPRSRPGARSWPGRRCRGRAGPPACR